MVKMTGTETKQENPSLHWVESWNLDQEELSTPHHVLIAGSLSIFRSIFMISWRISFLFWAKEWTWLGQNVPASWQAPLNRITDLLLGLHISLDCQTDVAWGKYLLKQKWSLSRGTGHLPASTFYQFCLNFFLMLCTHDKKFKQEYALEYLFLPPDSQFPIPPLRNNHQRVYAYTSICD